MFPIRIVLVEPSHPGNIGSAARAMKTMGLQELFLVRPRRFPHAEATAMASGADDLLARAVVVDDLDSALADCRLALATSARARSLRWPEVDPREAARELVAAAGQGPAALLFGREQSGLTNDELARCGAMVRIPANPAYPSLNLAAAVQILAYELRMAQPGALPAAPAPAISGPEAPASGVQLEGLYAHLERSLVASGFLDPANPRQLMRRLRRLFARAAPTENEVAILRGFLSAVDKLAGKG